MQSLGFSYIGACILFQHTHHRINTRSGTGISCIKWTDRRIFTIKTCTEHPLNTTTLSSNGTLLTLTLQSGCKLLTQAKRHILCLQRNITTALHCLIQRSQGDQVSTLRAEILQKRYSKRQRSNTRI